VAAPLFVKAAVIGFSIAAPVGPIGVLCIRRTLADGRAAGFASGLGAAVADSLYGLVGALGLTAISSVLVGQQTPLRLVGGGFLLFLAVRTFLAAPAHGAARTGGGGWFASFGSTFLLTLTNPATILSFAAVFAGLGVAAGARTAATVAMLVLGVFFGSALWWLSLSLLVGGLRERIDPTRLRWIHRCSGAVIAGFGIVALAGVAR
jgi:threonine/homoserine/homoserine lactone efflux protein